MPQWLTWLGHFGAGLVLAGLLGQFGFGAAVGFYGCKEYKESGQLKHISNDNVMDFIAPVVGGAVGMLLHGLLQLP